MDELRQATPRNTPIPRSENDEPPSMSRPTIVCLCGSTRFGDAFREANLRETLAGRIVLSIGCEWHSDQALGLTQVDKDRLDDLHLRKIDLADEILILNVNDYIGESTRRELAYAQARDKTVRWLEPHTRERCSWCGDPLSGPGEYGLGHGPGRCYDPPQAE